MYRLIIEHIIRTLIEEVFAQSTTRKVRDQLVNARPNKIRAAGKTNRVYAPDISEKEFRDLIKSTFNITNDSDIKIHRAKEGSLSSQFSTFEFLYKENPKAKGESVKIVLAKGKIAGEEEELKQQSSISGQIKEVDSINLKIRKDGEDIVLENIDGFVRISGNKKADFAFTSGGKPVLFLQHKGETHQQMSGTAKFDLESETYSQLGEFVEKVRTKVDSSPNLRLQNPIFEPITNNDFKVKAVYGSQDNSPNGVQVYAVGDLKLEGKGKVKTLNASRIFYYPEIPTGPDEPVLGAKYSADRSQYRISNVRFGVYPRSYFSKSK